MPGIPRYSIHLCRVANFSESGVMGAIIIIKEMLSLGKSGDLLHAVPGSLSACPTSGGQQLWPSTSDICVTSVSCQPGSWPQTAHRSSVWFPEVMLLAVALRVSLPYIWDRRIATCAKSMSGPLGAGQLSADQITPALELIESWKH